ncbi:MAG: tryptophan-rich sensory protein [Chloroflexia bacterium]|nr:tryptophan-rich sensory protein [Chloroflexia bacterium]
MTDDTRSIGRGSRDDAPGDSDLRSTRSTGGRRRVDPANPWFWPLINLVGLVVVVVVNALANIIPFNDITTGEVVNQDPIFFQPAGWVFSIWGFIYLLLAVFVVYSLLPRGRRDFRMSRIGPLFLVANIANIVWLFLWHYEQWVPSVTVIAALLIALALIYAGLRRTRRNRPPDTMERLMVWTPFSVYLGWIVVAFIANVSVWRDRTGTEVIAVSDRWWAVVMILVVLAITAVMALWMHDPAFVLVTVWASVGIGVEQWDRSMLVAIIAFIAALLAAALAVVASLIAYEKQTVATALPQSVPPKHRSSVLTRGRRSDSGDRD